jgi:hypothetical protein
MFNSNEKTVSFKKLNWRNLRMTISVTRRVPAQCALGKVLAKPIYGNNNILLGSGIIFTKRHIEKLRELNVETVLIVEDINEETREEISNISNKLKIETLTKIQEICAIDEKEMDEENSGFFAVVSLNILIGDIQSKTVL